MADPSGNVQAPGLQPLLCGALQHTAADGQAPPEALLQGASVAWGHLRPAERKAIRATCRNGRHLHDSLTIGLRIVMGRDVTQQEQQQQEEEHKHEKHDQQQQQQEQQHQHRHQPAPPELRASLAAMVRRGAQLRSLVLRFDDPDDDRRQAQLLAAVKACSWHSLSCLELRGAVSLSRVVAEAVARCCPQLADLRLVQKQTTLAADPTAFVALSGEAAAEYDYGRSQLLALCGPRLRELQLVGIETEQFVGAVVHVPQVVYGAD